jgi:hypothetical protein
MLIQLPTLLPRLSALLSYPFWTVLVLLESLLGSLYSTRYCYTFLSSQSMYSESTVCAYSCTPSVAIPAVFEIRLACLVVLSQSRLSRKRPNLPVVKL